MCRPDDFPPYGETTTPNASTDYNGWKTRATWSAWNWLSGGDEMVFRLARTRFRTLDGKRFLELWPEDRFLREIGFMAIELLRESGGPLAAREIELAGGFGKIDALEIANAVVELFENDDRSL